MALTDIARQLKETFDGFGGSEHLEEVQRFRELYGDAECIQIGEMNYIVINEVYRSREYADVPESTSPLFYSSINNTYAIIDAETSSTLIDEVYSRVTYMQRAYKLDVAPDKKEIQSTLTDLIGVTGERITDVYVPENESSEKNTANIFQCQLVKDTGVSASPDTYSFMMKNGEIKEIADHLMRQIKRSGEVNLLRDRDVIQQNQSAIQLAVFDKYVNSDMDISNITVKSIFEIVIPFSNIWLTLVDNSGRVGQYYTSYLVSENNEFAALNANIHVCNECGHELVDVKDPNNIHRLHVNMDALDPNSTDPDNPKYAVGCEDCLVQCEHCGGWHFDYEKFIGSHMYDKVKLAPGREFIKGLRSIDGCNYCPCREGIEWVYDERSGNGVEHDVLPISKLSFINYANEQIASAEEYVSGYAKELEKKTKRGNALTFEEEQAIAKQYRLSFRKSLAAKFDIDLPDINISSSERCTICDICGGAYYNTSQTMMYDASFRCNVCTELISEKRRMVTRVDGTVFMRHKVKKNTVISKYIVTKLGNLKEISSSTVNLSAPAAEEEETESVETVVAESVEVTSAPAEE